MSSHAVPVLEVPTAVTPSEVSLVTSGDLCQSANKVCWAAQAAMEKAAMMAELGIVVHLCGD